jgi:DNA polymerase-4
MGKLTVRYLWGAGRKTVDRLEALGFKMIRDIQECNQEKLNELFGKYGLKMWELANGIDERPVTQSVPRKSISQEITFGDDVDRDDYIETVLFRIADSLTRKMRREGIRGRTVTLKIRLTPFETHTRSCTLPGEVNDMQKVRSTAVKLYRDFNRKGRKVRLVGIGVSNLLRDTRSSPEQLDLFGGGPGFLQSETDRVLDQMKRLYGEKVTRAAFLHPK